MAETSPPSWSDIPLELAGLVLRRLPAHVDRVRFATVCPQWRVAAREVPLPPPLPLLALPDGTVYSLPESVPFRIPGCAGYTDACGNWLVFSREDSCFLRDPFSDAIMTVPALSRFRVRFVGDEPVDEAGLAWLEMDEGEDLNVCKVMFCSSHLIAAIVRVKSSRTHIAVCKPGPTSCWSVSMVNQYLVFVDLAFHQGNLLTFGMGTLFTVDIRMDHSTCDPWVCRVQPAISRVPCPIYILRGEDVATPMHYLVELHGVLLMVRRKMYGRCKKMPYLVERGTVIPTGRNEFNVFKADFQHSKWTEMTTIGDDQVLFLRRRCSRFVCVSQSDQPGDCIVFLENDGEDHNWYDKDS